MKWLVVILALTTSMLAHAQDSTELKRRNGFKAIHLGSPIDSIKGAVFKKELKEKDEFQVKLYDVDNTEFKSIGEVKVKEIKLKTYQNLIYEIVVITEKDDRMITALEKSFGKANYIPRDMVWKWGASSLSLTFVSHKNFLELTYRSHPVIQKMYTDKGKKLDAIAEGF